MHTIVVWKVFLFLFFLSLSWRDSPLVDLGSSQRPLPDKTQHSQQTGIHAAGGIRTHYLNRRAAVDLRLRPRGHWDRLISLLN